jgi:hypothetical protein
MPVYDNLILPAGEFYFDKFLPGTLAGVGYRQLGNVPEATIAKNSEQLEHRTSRNAKRQMDRRVSLYEDLTITFTTDNFSPINAAEWYGGTATPVVQASAASLNETITVKKGRVYQLGRSASNPGGLGMLGSTLTVTAGSTPVAAPNNWIFRPITGMVEIMSNAADIDDDDVLTFAYSALAGNMIQVVDGSPQIYGALKFVSDNTEGPNSVKDWPFVQLAADGDMSLITDTWGTMSFTAAVLSQNDVLNRYYERYHNRGSVE